MLDQQHESPLASPTRVSNPVWQSCSFIARGLFNLAVVVAFTFAVSGAIWLFYNGYPWHVAATTLALFMVAAFCAGNSMRERIVLSLCMPFLALGGLIGFKVYFAMFTFSWFEAVFNSKDSGPLGLILFVCGFAVATAIGAAWSMDRLSYRAWPPAVPSKNGEQSGQPEPPITPVVKS